MRGCYGAAVAASDAPLGLRERKNRRTRRAIVAAAVELTLQDGWAAATIPRIAERADVSPRTVSTWFPAKDDIVFGGLDGVIERATAHLRSDEGDVLDRLQAWIADEDARETVDLDAELTELRGRALEHDADLRARERAIFAHVQSEIAVVAARDHGLRPDAMGPQLFADAAMAMLLQLRAAGLAHEPGPVRARVGRERLDAGLRFLRAGLATLRPGDADR